MRFKQGESGNPRGRPRGTVGGRTLALLTLDKILARASNQSRLAKALEKEFRKDPVRFFKTVIMPLLPKEAKLSVDNDGIIQWRSLIGNQNAAPSGGGNPEPAAGAVGSGEPRLLSPVIDAEAVTMSEETAAAAGGD